MRLWVMSDLHTEFAPFEPPHPLPDANACVVAGDFGVRGIVPALEWLHRHVAHAMPVIFVAGNHDYYRTSYVDALREGKEAAARFPSVHFLENTSVELGGVTFLGCTLWTDFDLHRGREFAMMEARRAMTDYKRIKYSKQPYARFTPHTSVRLHLDSRAWLERTLAEVTGRVVVVTHHAPSEQSVPERFRTDPLSPAYASDLEALMGRHAPHLWVHGHIHDAVDYLVGETPVVSNPRGYPGEEGASGFRPGWVVDIGDEDGSTRGTSFGSGLNEVGFRPLHRRIMIGQPHDR
jgi:Icc-related predicted phosphoesterase